MSLQFIFGNSGAGKSYTLYRSVIEDSIRNPEQSYLVIVPEQFTMQTQKELVRLHPDGGILNIDILSFQRLAYRVFEETGTQVGKVLEETGKNLVLRKLAQEKKGELKVLGGNLKKMGYISEIKSLISELTQYAVTEEALSRLVEQSREKPQLYYKLQDVQVLYRAFHAYLADQYITAEELLEVLCRVVEQSALIRESVIVLDGFTGFTPIQNLLLQKLMLYAKKVVVTVTIDERENPYRVEGEHQLFYLSKKTVAGLKRLAEETGVPEEKPLWVHPGEKSRFSAGGELAWLEQNLFRLRWRSCPENQGSGQIRLQLLKNPEEEVAWAAGKIRELIREKQYHYRDFALITGDMEAYSPVLERVLEDYGIPCFLDNKRSILKNPFVEWIRALLEIAEQDFSYESVFRYLRSGLSGMKPEEVDLLENYVLALGIRGAKRWEDRFIRSYRGLTEEDLERIDSYRARVAEDLLPFVKIQRKKAVDVRTRTTALYELIVKKGIQGRLAVFEERFKRENNQVLAKEYHQIYGILMDLLDKLVDLLGEEELTVREYTELLEAGFGEARVGVIPPGVDQVMAGDMERTRLKDVKVLFFLGVNEGSVPKNASRAGLLSDMEREQLRGAGMELAPTAREQGYIQRFYLYLNLTKPSERLYISCTLLDGGGKALRPSYLMNVMKRLFPALTLEQESARSKSGLPRTEGEGLRLLIEGLKEYREGRGSGQFYELYRWYARQERYEEKLAQLLEGAFSAHRDTKLGKAVAHALYGTVLENSVTRLEQYAACAYAHFLMYGLKLSEREQYEFAPVDMGNIFHETLEAFSKKLDASDYTWKTLPREVADDWVEECLAALTVDYGNTVLNSTARNQYMIRRMARILKRTVWALGEQIRKGLFTPENYEISFSSVSDLESVNLELSPEEKLKLRGRIDRVDTCEDEEHVYVKVIDYKSGSTSFQLLSLYHGLQLQLVVYLNAAMELMKKEYPDKDVLPAGILYYQIQDPVLDTEGEEEDITARVLEKLKPGGLLNQDPEIIRRLDQSMPGRSQVLPISYNKDGTLRSGSPVASEAQFAALSRYVNRKIRTIGSEVLEGRMDVNPYELKGRTACDYCAYSGVCGLDSKTEGYHRRRLPVFDDGEIWKRIEEEEL
ncbi:helicase-exonuclease AddAB subunit AddB [Candidatus Merdisoma sp. HCP28S3_D10]